LIQIKAFDTPETLLQIVPKTLQENIQFRMDFHQLLSSDESMQNIFLEMCFQKPQLYFNLCCFTFDPRKPRGYKNIPFLLRPAQSDVIDALKEHIDYGKDMLIDKSRDEGATELICKLFAFYWRFEPQCQLLMGSRKAEYVDKGVEIVNGRLVGLHKSLLHKICYAFTTLPAWLRPTLLKTYMLLQNLDNSSVVSGEATNENFGAGDRQRGILVDEFGRIDHNMALDINDSVNDTSDCVIFNSTHFHGVEHPYNQLLTQKYGEVPVIIMPWTSNPNKNKGLYLSPDYDVIEIKDIDYYREICPEVFNAIEPMKGFKLAELRRENKDKPWSEKLEAITFTADGGDLNEGGWRSVWYDSKCRTRRPRDIACNIDRRPKGSGASVFTSATMHRIEQSTIRPPSFSGDVVVKRNREGFVVGGYVVPGGVGRLKWWGKLKNGRPDLSHSFIVGGDIGLGRGASNSVLSIIDVNLSEEVGQWVCPNTSPEEFADIAVAICIWTGGPKKSTYLIWESNGIGGVFEGRVVKNKYPFIYVRRDETAKRKKKKNKLGWCSTKGPEGTKYRLLMELDVALKEGLSKQPISKHLTIHCVHTLREMESYLFNNAGTPHPAKVSDDDDSNASAAHGDRVIALGLCCLALTYQPKAFVEKQKQAKGNSLGNRMKTRKRELAKKNNLRFSF